MNSQSFRALLSEATKVDLKQRKEIEKQLAKEARQNLTSLKELVASDEVAIRRVAVEILRRIGTDADALELLIRRLGSEPDVKTRRRLAAAIADSEQTHAISPLLDQLEREEHRFVQASLILALGKLGLRDWPKHWLDFSNKEGPVAEAMRKARAQTVERAGDGPEVSGTRDRPDGTYLLQIYSGLAPLVQLELRMVGLTPARERAHDWLALPGLSLKNLSALGRLRTIVADYHLALSSPAGDLKTLLSAATTAIVRAAPHLGERGSFRLSLPEMRTRSDYRKTVVSLSRHVETTTAWINHPSDYDIDLRIIRVEAKEMVVWRDRRWVSARQAESRAVVPASIHPSVAAALCLAASESYLPVMMAAEGEGKVLLDPCCGAGTILSEWLTIFPRARAIGYDISEQAIQLSRNNLAAFKSRCEVAVGDMRELNLEDSSVDFIACNLPFGLRVKHGSSNQALYNKFAKEAWRVLRPGGYLVTYTADRRAIESALRSQSWGKVAPLTTLVAGGTRVTIHRVRKSNQR